ncbi:hypothetical protein NVP2275O_064 [Vibrio phage 2.275.O._10N.286.54.E11]|nr:hypothetical protein NVP2275O_064 [Vibrio phage 2.275.O._10N.286.54.E11]
MSLGGCITCWDDPCTCREQYKYLTTTARVKLAKAIFSAMTVDEIKQVIPELDSANSKQIDEADFGSLNEIYQRGQ